VELMLDLQPRLRCSTAEELLLLDSEQLQARAGAAGLHACHAAAQREPLQLDVRWRPTRSPRVALHDAAAARHGTWYDRACCACSIMPQDAWLLLSHKGSKQPCEGQHSPGWNGSAARKRAKP
jgi:hypothetical protein